MVERDDVLGIVPPLKSCHRATCISFLAFDGADQAKLRAQMEEICEVMGHSRRVAGLTQVGDGVATARATGEKRPLIVWRAEFPTLEAQRAIDAGEKLLPAPCKICLN